MNTKKTTKFFALFLAVIMCALTLAACSKQPPVQDSGIDELQTKYLAACDKLEQGEYAAAYELFVALGDYKDAAKLAARFHYVPTTITENYVDAEGHTTENATHTYNEKNLPATCVYVNGDYRHTCTYTYNDSCKIIKLHCTDTDGLEEYFEYEYDEDGNLIKETDVFADGSTYSYAYTYNDKGYVATRVAVTSEGDTYLSEYTYDENGNEILYVSTSDGMSVRYESVYDDEGKKIAEYQKDENGNEITRSMYTYDEKGRKIKQSRFVMDDEFSYTEYTYDDKDQLLREYFSAGEDTYILYEYTYDDHGNVIKSYRINSDNEERTHEVAFKLTYIPYDFTAEEWQDLNEYITSW
jgi:hypothetical protein